MKLIPLQIRNRKLSITALAMSTTMPSQQSTHNTSSIPIAFDAHNHIHLSMQGGIQPLKPEEMNLISGDSSDKMEEPIDKVVIGSEVGILSHAESIIKAFSSDEIMIAQKSNFHIGGIAMMSTQPRDFPIVKKLANALSTCDGNDKVGTIDPHNEMHVVRCYGVHPWFLKQANDDFVILKVNNTDQSRNPPPWLAYLRHNLETDPTSHVGEIGLDGARYDIDPLTREKVLAASMESQIEAFESQMHLAADLKRSVSVHAVRCWGPLMNSLNSIKKKRMKMRKDQNSLRKRLERERQFLERNDETNQSVERINEIEDDMLVLPPIIYFHAFGGKPAVVDQLDAICREKSVASHATETFYGFAPVVNFQSPKTELVMEKVGIERLVLESDLEDYHSVLNDLETSVGFTARVFGMGEDDVLRQTNANARYIYGLTNY